MVSNISFRNLNSQIDDDNDLLHVNAQQILSVHLFSDLIQTLHLVLFGRLRVGRQYVGAPRVANCRFDLVT